MKTYKGLFEKLIDKKGIKQDILKASLGKRQKEHIIRRTGSLYAIDIKTETTPELEKTIETIYNMYVNNFDLKVKKNYEINDGVRLKKRNIRKPTFVPEQVMTHGIVRVMEDIMTRGMYEFVCGSVPGRGTHYGKRFIENWINHDPENVKYVAKADIKRFFESVSRRRTKKLLKKYIKDKRFLEIVFKFLNVFIEGLALGYYISQWFANFILQDMDYYIKQKSLLDVKTKKEINYKNRMARKGITDYKVPKYRCGATYYIRYMDDMVMFGNNKKELHLIIKRIEAYLKNELGLRIKGDWQVFRFDYIDRDSKRKGRPLDFMGFVFYRDKTILRKTILIRATRKASRMHKKGNINCHDASSMLSYMGYIKHTHTYHIYLERIKPCINIKYLKKVVSKHQRKVNKNVRMAKGNLYASTSLA
ncbi:reverse transcriptase domain-containing protein [bacterium]|nr:reverse transcriptase domain-containing protein [bacterium]